MNIRIGIVTVLYNSESVLADFFMSLSTQSYQNFVLYLLTISLLTKVWDWRTN